LYVITKFRKRDECVTKRRRRRSEGKLSGNLSTKLQITRFFKEGGKNVYRGTEDGEKVWYFLPPSNYLLSRIRHPLFSYTLKAT
jgi:hypothetical protein